MTLYLDSLQVPSGTDSAAVRACITEFVRTSRFGRRLPPQVLVRTVFDVSGSKLDDLPNFLITLAYAGHDRANPSVYGYGFCNKITGKGRS